MKFFLTGAAGFIGFHVTQRLLAQGHDVLGIDNLNDYYDVGLKRARLALLQELGGFRFLPLDLAEREATAALFAKERPDRVIHLAAQAGVRYSLDHPHAYADANLVGHLNVLEGCRQTGVGHLLYASSSSVYGLNRRTPYRITDTVDHPVSLYAATKKANELMSHSYSHLYDLPTTGLRFFTVYGPWGRPDMAYFKFTKAILEGVPIEVYNHGDMRRDFTYVDDIAEAVVRLQDRIPTSDPTWTVEAGSPGSSSAPYRVYNIGNSRPESLLTFIRELETALGRKASVLLKPMQPGDVLETCADTSALEAAIGFKPCTDLATGLGRFVAWYRHYYTLS
jgi:UDP-glucuronate 4-epimerase